MRFIVKLLKKCDAIPGYRLFKYFDDKKNHNEITSQDINTYLHNLTNHSFTAKDFRTWGACRETFYRLSQIQNSDEISPKTLKAAICEVANILGHTPAICQKSYIYPEIIALWKKQQIKVWLDKQPKKLIHDKDQLLLKWLEAHS